MGLHACYALVYPLPALEDRLLLESLLILRYFPERNRGLLLGVRGDGMLNGGLWEIRYRSR